MVRGGLAPCHQLSACGRISRLSSCGGNEEREPEPAPAVDRGGAGRDEPDTGGMDRQTLRDWVHRFNEHGPDRLRDTWSKGNPPRLSPDQQAELARIVEIGPD